MYVQRVPLNTPWWMRQHNSRQSPCTFNKANRKDQGPNYLNLLCFDMCFSKKMTAIYLGLLFCWGLYYSVVVYIIV